MYRIFILRSLSLLVLTLSGTLAYSQIEVCKTCPIKTIKEGLAKAKPHQKVTVKGGIYKEHSIIIDKPITLITHEKATIDAENKEDIIQIFADNVTIDGFQLINVASSYTKDYTAIRVNQSTHFTLQNLELRKTYFGLYVAKSSHGVIQNNKVIGDAKFEHNSGNAIHVWHSHNLKIDNNIVTGSRDGIYLEFADTCIISNNISKNNLRYGLHFMFSNDNVYKNNLFESNGAGVAVMFSKRIDMFENKFKYNWGGASYGLLLKEIDDAKIEGNLFEENTTAIHAEGSNRLTYRKNTFKSNGWALKLQGACYHHTFTQNNFLYNSFDLSYKGRMNGNTFNENYWSGYTGYDLNKDGFGDVPYRPVKLFSYIVNRSPEAIILMRSLFIDIIDFSESVSPAFTPDELKDERPLMRQVK